MRPIMISIPLLLLLLLPVRMAFAGLPSPGNWIIPSHVRLVALGPAGPDSVLGHATCVIRDLANNPMAGSVVTFDFSGCADLAIAIDQLDPRLVTNCSARSVSAVTDANGIVRFTIIGTGTAAPAHPPHSLHIWVDGFFAGSPSVAVLDRDGVNGLTGVDLSIWLADFFTGTNPERADLDGSGTIGGSDASLWLAAFVGGRNVYSAAPYCP